MTQKLFDHSGGLYSLAAVIVDKTTGAPPLSLPIDFSLAAGANRLSGQSSVTAFGYVANITSTDTNVNLWQPQVAWTLPSAPVGIEYSSTSASDGVAGTGGRKILVIGCGINFALQVEVVTMNGTTVVPSAYTWMAINVMVVFDDPTTGFGSNLTNVGAISAKVTGAGALHGYIDAGKGVSKHGRYTVPAGYTWLVNNFFFLGNKSGGAQSSFSLDAISITANGLLLYGLPLTMQNGAVLQIALPNTPVPVPEKNTLMFRVASVSTGGLDISGGCTGVLSAN